MYVVTFVVTDGHKWAARQSVRRSTRLIGEQTNSLSSRLRITLVSHLAYSPPKKWPDLETIFHKQFGGVKCV
jgi:hypothetical protein